MNPYRRDYLSAISKSFQLVKLARYIVNSVSILYRQIKYPRMSKKLDREFEARRNRKLGEYPYLILYCRYEKLRKNGKVRNVATLSTVGGDTNLW